MQRLVIELLEYFRNVLICMYAPDAPPRWIITEAQLDVLKEQAASSAPGRVLQIVQILTDTENRLRYALSRRTLGGDGLIRSARAATVVSIDEILKELTALEGLAGRRIDDIPPLLRSPEVTPSRRPSPRKKKACEPEKAPGRGRNPPIRLPQGRPPTCLPKRWRRIISGSLSIGTIDRTGRAYRPDGRTVSWWTPNRWPSKPRR
jgi:DNA polymerase III gamma/tau subunit